MVKEYSTLPPPSLFNVVFMEFAVLPVSFQQSYRKLYFTKRYCGFITFLLVKSSVTGSMFYWLLTDNDNTF